MTIDFTCQKCDSSFELDAQDLIDGTEKLVCPNCDTKAPVTMVDDFISALSDLRTQAATLSKKFTLNLSIETDELADLEADDDDVDDDDEDGDDDEDLDDDDEDVDEEIEDEDLDKA